MMRVYLLHSEADDNGTLLITSPAFPEVTPFAKDEADIAQVAAAAIEEAIAARIRDGKEILRPASTRKLRAHKGPWVKLRTVLSLRDRP